MKFSIIIPVYNAEKYIDKCLASILGQTFENFECIVIDDGSSDNSNIIINKYTVNDQRFKVIHQENMGVGAVRNAGLDIAKGEYIIFIDADDYVTNDFLEKFALKICSTNADIVICSLTELHTDSIRSIVFEANNTEEIKKNILASVWPSYSWNKCYRKYLFENIRFLVGEIFEDVLIIPEVCLNAGKIVCIADKTYYYNKQNVNSITADMSTVKMYNLFQGLKKNRSLAVVNCIPCLKLLDEIMVKNARMCLLRNCVDSKLSEAQEQEMMKYLQERLDKSEITGVRNKFWVRMLLAKRKRICAWYARFRSK